VIRVAALVLAALSAGVLWEVWRRFEASLGNARSTSPSP